MNDALFFYTADAHIREVGNNKIRGVFASCYDPNNPTGTECQPLKDPNTYERLGPNCFDSCLQQDVYCTVAHNNGAVLGRTPATLQLFKGDNCYEYELDIADTQVGRDTRLLIARGDLRGNSYSAFPGRNAGDVTWHKRDKNTNAVQVNRYTKLVEITLTPCPAYSATMIQRSLDWYSEEYERWLKWTQTQAMIEKIRQLK